MAESLQSRMPDASPAHIDAERNKPNRAPTIIVVAAHITPGKIPELEQLLAVGAATQNMCLAAQALGFGTMWKTGAAAHDSKVKHALGLREDDHIGSLETGKWADMIAIDMSSPACLAQAIRSVAEYTASAASRIAVHRSSDSRRARDALFWFSTQSSARIATKDFFEPEAGVFFASRLEIHRQRNDE